MSPAYCRRYTFVDRARVLNSILIRVTEFYVKYTLSNPSRAELLAYRMLACKIYAELYIPLHAITSIGRV